MFFFNDTATTEIYTLSLPDALPICCRGNVLVRSRFSLLPASWRLFSAPYPAPARWLDPRPDPSRMRHRKSTRLNSSHANISYAVFCLTTNYIILHISVDAALVGHDR